MVLDETTNNDAETGVTVEQICCLIEDKRKCIKTASNANYTKKIQKTVQQRKLKLELDDDVSQFTRYQNTRPDCACLCQKLTKSPANCSNLVARNCNCDCGCVVSPKLVNLLSISIAKASFETSFHPVSL